MQCLQLMQWLIHHKWMHLHNRHLFNHQLKHNYHKNSRSNHNNSSKRCQLNYQLLNNGCKKCDNNKRLHYKIQLHQLHHQINSLLEIDVSPSLQKLNDKSRSFNLATQSRYVDVLASTKGAVAPTPNVSLNDLMPTPSTGVPSFAASNQPNNYFVPGLFWIDMWFHFSIS